MSAEATEVPGLRAMAIVRWVILAAVVITAGATWWIYVLASDAPDQREHRYYCPMHPQIRSPDPGTCPICFMNLEPIPDHPSTVRADDAGIAPPEDAPLAPVMLTTERRQRAGIATVLVERRAIEGTARWPASVEEREGARGEVRVRASAFVERVLVRETGVRVRAGQPLALVYSSEILAAQEELLTAHRWRGEGQETLMSAARQRLQLLGMSEHDVDAVITAGRSRRTIAVRAPIAGHVTRVDAVVGTYAGPETLLYEIADLSRVRVVATPFADETDLEPGMAAQFRPRSGGEPVPLTLELVEPRVASDTRALRVRFIADNDALALRPRDIGEVVLERSAREVIAVPRDAVIDTGTRRYVFVERAGGVFEPRSVETGALAGELRIIDSGLEPGERVVARGAFVLDSESRLQAALAPADAGAAR